MDLGDKFRMLRGTEMNTVLGKKKKKVCIDQKMKQPISKKAKRGLCSLLHRVWQGKYKLDSISGGHFK